MRFKLGRIRYLQYGQFRDFMHSIYSIEDFIHPIYNIVNFAHLIYIMLNFIHLIYSIGDFIIRFTLSEISYIELLRVIRPSSYQFHTFAHLIYCKFTKFCGDLFLRMWAKWAFCRDFFFWILGVPHTYNMGDCLGSLFCGDTFLWILKNHKIHKN